MESTSLIPTPSCSFIPTSNGVPPRQRHLPAAVPAVVSLPSIRRPSASTSVAAAGVPRYLLGSLVNEFRSLPEPLDRVKRLLVYAAALPPFPDVARVPANSVAVCTAQVWLWAAMDTPGRMLFAADSDSEIAKGFCACLIATQDGAFPEEVLELRPEHFCDLDVVGVHGRAHSTANTWHNVLMSMQKQTKALVAGRHRQHRQL